MIVVSNLSIPGILDSVSLTVARAASDAASASALNPRSRARDVFAAAAAAAREALERTPGEQAGPGDIVAVWGCGPVGQFAIHSAFMLGAERVFALDFEEGRLALARKAGAETIDLSEQDSYASLMELTGGKLPNRCVDAVGMEAHGASVIGNVYDRVKTTLMMETDRPNALRDAIMCCRKGGAVSIPGVYAGLVDKFPIGAAFGKGLMLRGGQTNTRAYMDRLLKRIEAGEIDPSFVITHRASLDEAPELYKTFRDKQGGCIKVVLNPWA